MTQKQAFFMMSVIYVAPHMNAWVAIGCAAVFLILALAQTS